MILINFKVKSNKKSQNNLVNETGILFADYSWNLVNFVGKDFSKLLEGKSNEFISGFNFCIEQYRNELIKMSD